MNVFRTEELNVVIVGLGLIGGSMARAIRKYVNVKKLWAIDINEETLKKAENQGIIDTGFINSKDIVSQGDLVILCTYPSLAIEFVKENIHFFKKNALITDTAGIKLKLMNELRGIIRSDLDFIGGHPMAGKELQGFDFSDEDLFKESQYILVPSNNSKSENIGLLKYIISELKVRNIIELSPEKHDEMVAFTSQLPHIIACTLMNSNMISNSFDCIGGSFKDATRVAKINCDLWVELFMENKEYIVKQLKDVIKDMEYMGQLIDENKSYELREQLNKGGNLRREMDLLKG